MATAKKRKFTLETVDEFYRIVKPGDILQFHRGVYSHYGIYIGEYRGIKHCVIHLTVSEEMEGYYLFKVSVSLKELERSHKRELQQVAYLVEKMNGETHGELRTDSVEDIMTLGGVVIINNEMEKKWKAASSDEVVKRAINSYENRHMERPYHLAKNNCENFVNRTKYGEDRSTQVDTVKNVAIGTAVGGAVLLGALWLGSKLSKDSKTKEGKKVDCSY